MKMRLLVVKDDARILAQTDCPIPPVNEIFNSGVVTHSCSPLQQNIVESIIFLTQLL